MNIYNKIFDLKKNLGKLSKDQLNPFYNSKYMDINKLLENIEPLLQERKLLLLQPIESDKVTTIIHDLEEEGSFIRSSIDIPDISDPQKIGSIVTYYRRYTLKSLLGIQEEDDDGNKASIPEKKWLNKDTKQWDEAIKYLSEGGSINKIEDKYKISKSNREELLTQSI